MYSEVERRNIEFEHERDFNLVKVEKENKENSSA